MINIGMEWICYMYLDVRYVQDGIFRMKKHRNFIDSF